jgi:small subunit ribosomal protein S5
MAENKETVLSTEATAVETVATESVEAGEREARRGSRERGPRNERREREEKKSEFLERVVTINLYQRLLRVVVALASPHWLLSATATV